MIQWQVWIELFGDLWWSSISWFNYVQPRNFEITINSCRPSCFFLSCFTDASELNYFITQILNTLLYLLKTLYIEWSNWMIESTYRIKWLNCLIESDYRNERSDQMIEFEWSNQTIKTNDKNERSNQLINIEWSNQIIESFDQSILAEYTIRGSRFYDDFIRRTRTFCYLSMIRPRSQLLHIRSYFHDGLKVETFPSSSMMIWIWFVPIDLWFFRISTMPAYFFTKTK